MNIKDTIGPMCVAGIAIAVLSIAFVHPFLTPHEVSAQGGGTTTDDMIGMSNAEGRNATIGMNATGAMAGEGGNQSASEVRMHINEALSAARSGNMQAVIMHLNLALNAIGGSNAGTQGNMTGAATAGDPMSGAMTTSNQDNVIKMRAKEVDEVYRWTAASDGSINPTLKLVANTNNIIQIKNPTDEKHELVIESNGRELASSGDINPDSSGQLTFKPTVTGTLGYHCEYHPETMKGTIQVGSSS